MGEDLEINVKISCHGERNSPCFDAYITIDIEEWKRPYCVKEFYSMIRKTIKSLDQSDFEVIELNDNHDMRILFHVENDCEKIGEKREKALAIIISLLDKSISSLICNLDKITLITFFHFPSEIKAVCQQYLMYFTQFLSDLAIEAQTEIKEESYYTLFRIFPKDKCEAFSKIQELLNYYLNAPGILTQSVLQAKDSTIEALQLTNYQYSQLLEKMDHNKSYLTSEEEIIPGIITVKKFDWKGLTINLPEIVRRLKRKLHKK